MTDVEAQELKRQNDYLKLRCAQLQGDVTDLGAENMRMRQELERVSGRREGGPANPLSGGQ
jgi:hypothetical protein